MDFGAYKYSLSNPEATWNVTYYEQPKVFSVHFFLTSMKKKIESVLCDDDNSLENYSIEGIYHEREGTSALSDQILGEKGEGEIDFLLLSVPDTMKNDLVQGQRYVFTGPVSLKPEPSSFGKWSIVMEPEHYECAIKKDMSLKDESRDSLLYRRIKKARLSPFDMIFQMASAGKDIKIACIYAYHGSVSEKKLAQLAKAVEIYPRLKISESRISFSDMPEALCDEIKKNVVKNADIIVVARDDEEEPDHFDDPKTCSCLLNYYSCFVSVARSGNPTLFDFLADETFTELEEFGTRVLQSVERGGTVSESQRDETNVSSLQEIEDLKQRWEKEKEESLKDKKEMASLISELRRSLVDESNQSAQKEAEIREEIQRMKAGHEFLLSEKEDELKIALEQEDNLRVKYQEICNEKDSMLQKTKTCHFLYGVLIGFLCALFFSFVLKTI